VAIGLERERDADLAPPPSPPCLGRAREPALDSFRARHIASARQPSISCPGKALRRALSGSVGDDGALERRRLDSEVLKDPDLVLAQPTQRHVRPAVRQRMAEYCDSEVMEFAHLREIEVETFIGARWDEKSLETSGCEAIEDALQADHRVGGSRVFESHQELRERAGKRARGS
jgi:hypothetical protein